MMIPEEAPVRLLNAQREDLEYGKLYEAYSSKGRKSAADPRVLFKVLVHGYLCGIYSSRKLEEACQYRIDFRWLLEERKANPDAEPREQEHVQPEPRPSWTRRKNSKPPWER